MRLLLDTCAIVWVILDPDRLSASTRALLRHRDHEVCFCPLAAAEIACAVDRGRLSLDRHWRPWFRHFSELNGWMEIPVELDIVEEAYALPPPFHQDPIDRLLVATARLRQCTMVTGDRRILDYPHVSSLA